MNKLLLIMVIFAVTTPAYAYVGPGMGAGTFAVALGIIGSIFLALFAVIYYPFKRMLKRKKAAKTAEHEQGDDIELDTGDLKLETDDRE